MKPHLLRSDPSTGSFLGASALIEPMDSEFSCFEHSDSIRSCSLFRWLQTRRPDKPERTASPESSSVSEAVDIISTTSIVVSACVVAHRLVLLFFGCVFRLSVSGGFFFTRSAGILIDLHSAGIRLSILVYSDRTLLEESAFAIARDDCERPPGRYFRSHQHQPSFTMMIRSSRTPDVHTLIKGTQFSGCRSSMEWWPSYCSSLCAPSRRGAFSPLSSRAPPQQVG